MGDRRVDMGVGLFLLEDLGTVRKAELAPDAVLPEIPGGPEPPSSPFLGGPTWASAGSGGRPP